MKILVTGGCGFIGSHLVDRLVAEGQVVTVLDNLSTGNRANLNPKATLIEGDVADTGLMHSLAVESRAIFHLAAIASVQVCEEEPERAEATNVHGTESVFKAAAGARIPVVYASSAAVYGDNPDLPLAETAEPKPLGAYGRHKLANEQTAAAYRDVPSVGLRFFNVYGPRQDPRSPYSGVISKFVANATSGQALTFFGDGGQTRDFIFVHDIVDLLMAALSQAKGTEIYNGCTGVATDLLHLAKAVGAALEQPVTTEHAEARVGDIRHSLGDPVKAHMQIGFEAQTSLGNGLKALVAHAT